MIYIKLKIFILLLSVMKLNIKLSQPKQVNTITHMDIKLKIKLIKNIHMIFINFDIKNDIFRQIYNKK